MDSREALRDASFLVAGWRVEPTLNRLSRDGACVHLRPQLCSLLEFFAKHPNQVLSKQEIFAAVWSGEYVSESALKAAIAELRRALGDDAREPRLIESISKRGYRLIAPVSRYATGDPISVSSPARQNRVPDLVPIGAAVVVAAAVALAGWFFAGRHRPSPVGEKLIVADFVNRTGESVFDGTLTHALRTQLEQSPSFRFVSSEEVRQALAQMTRSTDEAVTGAVAREVCVRTDAAVVLNGAIARLGSRYVVTVEATNCASGDVQAEEQREATDREHVLDALGRIASELRRKLGESAATRRRFDVPIQKATTASLEALKAFSVAVDVNARSGYYAAEPQYLRAIQLDPDFALPYAQLSIDYGLMNRVDERNRMAAAAYARRSKVTESERFLIDLAHCGATRTTPDGCLAIAEAWRRTYPLDPQPYRTLCLTEGYLGNYEASLVYCREAVRLAPDSWAGYQNLSAALAAFNKFAEAKRTVDEAFARHVDSPRLHQNRFMFAAGIGDVATMDQERAAARGTREEFQLLLRDSELAAFEGRFRDSRVLLNHASQLAGRRFQGLIAEAAPFAETVEAAAGFRPCAKPPAEIPSDQTGVADWITTALLCDDIASAERLLRKADANPVSSRNWLFVTLPLIEPARLMIAVAAGDRSAIRGMAPASPRMLGGLTWFRPLYLRGLVCLRAGNPVAAVAEFQRIIDHRGIWIVSGLYPLAYVQQGRAFSLAGDTTRARAAYETFFKLWAKADADVPILVAARAEYAALPR